ncbi:BQ5605_C009g05548 [Microbotryum silenes-dioicae]|uniref:BQ5605_C009g05548 protein n=1 Tax=Microbotryum silenes-dioicae TaxID=796604 RepID=A0A2X0N786_9BASI|nr:BQ5605_C009g05548 [Microbotryum silenes-dioicae]
MLDATGPFVAERGSSNLSSSTSSSRSGGGQDSDLSLNPNHWMHPQDRYRSEEKALLHQKEGYSAENGSLGTTTRLTSSSTPPTIFSARPPSSTLALLTKLPRAFPLGLVALLSLLYLMLSSWPSSITTELSSVSNPATWESSEYFDPIPNSSWSHFDPIDPVVRAASQRFRGRHSDDGVYVSWKGIRYAQAPTGDLRFRTARPVKPTTRPVKEKEWEAVEIQDAYDPGQGCPRWIKNPRREGVWEGEEDCLKLHIFAPAGQEPSKLLPVMFWIHGGGLASGSSLLPRYDYASLMKRSVEMNEPIIMVTFNYRLGSLGFSSTTAALKAGSASRGRNRAVDQALDLNVGFKDQLAALDWVKRHIESFGGDRKKITMAGHSAGAIAVGLHQLYTPDSFRGAFMLSGSPTSFPVPWPHEAARRSTHTLEEAAGCPKAAPGNRGSTYELNLIKCLRQLPLDSLMRSTIGLQRYQFPWYPVVESNSKDAWLTRKPSEMMASVRSRRVPFITGTVLDEGTKFTDAGMESEASIENALRRSFAWVFDSVQDGLLSRLWELYPDVLRHGSPYNTDRETFGLAPAYKRAASILGDLFFRAPKLFFLNEMRDVASTVTASGKQSMWNYLYSYQSPTKFDPKAGISHGADLADWFGKPRPKDPNADQIARIMSAYLINFVANLDPNGVDRKLAHSNAVNCASPPSDRYSSSTPTVPPWPRFSKKGETLHFTKAGRAIVGRDIERQPAIDFLNENNDFFAR